ncbi:unnamed protein product [Psylliodes chrysocephalus]|uniref:Uncharacterized protein n=1 Tax=Psylliodes chrysocephalus TaxID=3402493 RepID=A0A9P0D8X9_9CUCU|nr:unnamed protein product [Psylliodes chrysocephala]
MITATPNLEELKAKQKRLVSERRAKRNQVRVKLWDDEDEQETQYPFAGIKNVEEDAACIYCNSLYSQSKPAKDECALNCRATGMNFFATLNKTVIDGTPCLFPIAHTGKAAPKGTRGICIDGYCKAKMEHSSAKLMLKKLARETYAIEKPSGSKNIQTTTVINSEVPENDTNKVKEVEYPITEEPFEADIIPESSHIVSLSFEDLSNYKQTDKADLCYRIIPPNTSIEDNNVILMKVMNSKMGQHENELPKETEDEANTDFSSFDSVKDFLCTQSPSSSSSSNTSSESSTSSSNSNEENEEQVGNIPPNETEIKKRGRKTKADPLSSIKEKAKRLNLWVSLLIKLKKKKK